MKRKLLYATVLWFSITISFAQNTRLNDENSIGWYNYFGNFKLNNKWGVASEYQWRRNNFVTDPQQGLLRVGVNYQLQPNVQLRVGYAWIETAPYGEIPINGFGKDFSEHRAFQMLTINDNISRVEISHRFMLEQRWVGRYSSANLMKEDEFPLLNRLRYMCRVQVPLKGKTVVEKTPYLVLYDEIMIGFGKNVNENIFDQNRLGFLIGYRFNKNLRLESGYLNQTLQLGREMGNRNVFQRNNGIIFNAVFNLDFSK